MAVVLLCLWLYEDDGGGSTHALIKKCLIPVYFGIVFTVML